MHKFSEQITFKIITCVLVMSLLVPTGVKFSHIFTHHHHEICNGEPQTHLHNADLDCSFYKFKLSTPFTIPNFEFEIIPALDNHQSYAGTYSFLSEFQQLHFTLRGPPQIDLI